MENARVLNKDRHDPRLEALINRTDSYGFPLSALFSGDVVKLKRGGDGFVALRVLDPSTGRVAVTGSGPWLAEEIMGMFKGSRFDEDDVTIPCAIREDIIATGCTLELYLDRCITPVHRRPVSWRDIRLLIGMLATSAWQTLRSRHLWHPRMYALHHTSNMDPQDRKFHNVALRWFGTPLLNIRPMREVWVNNTLLLSADGPH